ncbi:hypothetical protein AB433_16690 [Croceicoccus naphthovorans]|uniref:Uncharacterized protein n=2 Tax=Croceicoccus naphthovorans TaxID=1348774 RepID=A0A0G3XI49_9SPHN|nr:hypothetical protein AB433_16690 [Croceicoccus naphthovorans]
MLDYRTEIQKLFRQVEMGVHEEAIYYIDIKSDYFSVYHSLSSQLGLLKPAEVTKLVRFYSYCKTFVDATRPEGVSSEMQGRLKSVTNLRALTTLHDSILCLGDEIVQLTKSPSIPDGTRV